MIMVAVSGDARALPDAACSGLPLMPLDAAAGQVFVMYCLGSYPTMVIIVACGPMAYKAQILAYHLRKKPMVDFCGGTKKSDSDDNMDEECSIFNVKTL
jgi:hypothetical protein